MVKLLLHACCAPCSSSVLEKLKDYDVTVYFYNPNILPKEEYLRRQEELVNMLEKLNIPYILDDYNNEDFRLAINGFENFPEKSERCKKCYYLRMEKTALLAKKLGFDYFTTTLSVSPHKNYAWILEIGKQLESLYGVKFYEEDFKKKDGYLRSLILSKEYGLYRQNYCGCMPKEN